MTQNARRHARALMVLLLLTTAGIARADDLVWTTGKVIGPDGKPLKGAVVVAYDDTEKVVDYGYTDEQGEYALAIPERVFNLYPSKGPGFLVRSIGKVKRFVNAQVSGLAEGAKTTIMALTTAQAGMLAAIPEPISKAALDTGSVVAGRVERQLTPKEKAEKEENELKELLKLPGVVYLRASAAGVTDFAGVGRVYWMQRETISDNAENGKEQDVFAAWLEPITFTASNSGKPSTIGSDFLKIGSAKLEPTLVPPGGKFKVTAIIPAPSEPDANLVVIARNAAGRTWELARGEKNTFTAEIAVDDKFPKGDQIISILGYPGGLKPGRREEAEKAIEKAGLWDLKKEFVPNPLLVATRTRADLKLSVLPAKSLRK